MKGKNWHWIYELFNTLLNNAFEIHEEIKQGQDKGCKYNILVNIP